MYNIIYVLLFYSTKADTFIILLYRRGKWTYEQTYPLCGCKITYVSLLQILDCLVAWLDCPKLTFTFSFFLTKRQVWWWRVCCKKKILINFQNGSAGGGNLACCIRSAETGALPPDSILSVTTKGWRWPSCTTPAARCMAGLPPRTGRAAAEFMSVTQRLSCLHWNTMANLHQWSFPQVGKAC